MPKRYRVAIGTIFTECNHFGGLPADLDTFRRGELRRGAEVLEQSTGTVGGMLEVLRERDVAVIPTVIATACPSGPLTNDCYETLKRELLDGIVAATPLDGVLMPLHGAAAAEQAGDLEGDLLAAVRARVGPDVPIVATLDLHAHVTEAMVHHADALLAWETYPHADAFETGRRGAKALLDILDGTLRPTMVMAKVPVLVSGVNGHTEGDGPFADVMRRAKSFERQSGVYGCSTFLVHPYLDLPDMGGGGLVITNDDSVKAESLALELAEMYWNNRFDLEPPTFTPDDAVQRGLALDGGPVLLVETSDCCGGGAAGDAVAALKALLRDAPDRPSLVPVVDPEAATACHEAGAGSTITLEVGHKVDPKWGAPVRVTGVVTRLGDGRFVYQGGFWDGQPGAMGPTAVLRIGAIDLLIASHGTYEWADEQYRSHDLDPSSAKFIVVKNPMNYRMSYGAAKATFILDTPGPTPPTLKHVRYRNLARPYYPSDEEIPDLTPTVLGPL